MAFEEFDLNGPLLKTWLEKLGKMFPPGRVAVRDAMKSGDLSTKLKDQSVLDAVKTWMESADPGDPEQRSEMVAVIKAMDPEKRELRQKAFELTFKTKLRSEERNYEPQMVTDRVTKQKKQKIGNDGLPVFFEGKPKSVPLDPKALTSITEILEQLPAGHMPQGWVLEGQDKPTDLSTHGSYDDRTDQAALTFSLNDVAQGGNFKYSTNCAPDDPLFTAKAFDLLIRHECGHKAGLTLGSRSLTSIPAAGGWIDHGDIEGVLGALDHEFQDFVKKVQVNDAPPVDKIRGAVKNEEHGFDASAIAGELKLPEARVPADHILLKVLQQGGINQPPYMLAGSPVSVGDRIYLVGGPDHHWFSFSKTAWQKRVSFYQYATPEEWFAEFYATANNRDAKLRQAAKTRYPEAWEWLKSKKCLVFDDK